MWMLRLINAGFETHVSHSEHSDRPRHGAATAVCVGIRSINDALLKPRQGNEPYKIFGISNVNNDNRVMSAVNGMFAMRAQRDDALSVNALLKSAKL